MVTTWLGIYLYYQLTTRAALSKVDNSTIPLGLSRPRREMSRLATTTNNNNDLAEGDYQQSHTEQTVQFHDQGQVSSDSAIASFKDLPKSYLDMAISTDREHTIHSFLERPIRITSFLFTQSQAVGQVLWTASFPNAVISNPMYKEKLRGFVGLRSDIQIRVQINAQKFQQGRVRLQYAPYHSQLQSKYDQINSHLAGRVACPGVDIDICGGSNPESRISEAVFTVPYVSPHLYYNLINGKGEYGRFYLFVYSPLLSADPSSNCEVTIWFKFINPIVQFPTAGEIFQAQIRGERKQLEKTGVVSDTLGKVAETLHVASKIPVIGSYLAIPEWIANTGSSVAKLFGWAKPTMTMDTKLRTNNCFANYNGKDSSYNFGLSSDNEIDTPSGIAGTDMDEMALAAICKIPSYIATFNWDITKPADYVLFAIPVTPVYFNSIPGTTNGLSVTPLGYVTNIFAQWHGSINYVFKLVKTGFHSGRLSVAFSPFTTVTAGSITSLEIEKCYREIFDIQEVDTITFNVPYVNTTPWAPTQGPGSSLGTIFVTVLNSLQRPDAVADNINIIVETYGGNDINFSIPTTPNYRPGVPTVSGNEVMDAQVMGTNITSRAHAQEMVDPKSISQKFTDLNWSPESHCIGEKVCSVRQLIKRNMMIGKILTGFQGTGSRIDGILIQPYANITSTVTHIDYYSYFNNIYAFFRGGIRIKVTCEAERRLNEGLQLDRITFQQRPRLKAVLLNNHTISQVNAGTFSTRVNNAIATLGFEQVNGTVMNSVLECANSVNVVAQQIEGMVELEIPFYNSTHLAPAKFATSSETIVPSQYDDDNTYPYNSIAVSVDDSISKWETTYSGNYELSQFFKIYRSAADDFGFHYLLGAPALLLNTVPDYFYTYPPQQVT